MSLEWQEKALCADRRRVNPDWWHPDKDRLSEALALTACRHCPVIGRCFEHTLLEDRADPNGIWGISGGMTRMQRLDAYKSQYAQLLVDGIDARDLVECGGGCGRLLYRSATVIETSVPSVTRHKGKGMCEPCYVREKSRERAAKDAKREAKKAERLRAAAEKKQKQSARKGCAA